MECECGCYHGCQLYLGLTVLDSQAWLGFYLFTPILDSGSRNLSCNLLHSSGKGVKKCQKIIPKSPTIFWRRSGFITFSMRQPIRDKRKHRDTHPTHIYHYEGNEGNISLFSLDLEFSVYHTYFFGWLNHLNIYHFILTILLHIPIYQVPCTTYWYISPAVFHTSGIGFPCMQTDWLNLPT